MPPQTESIRTNLKVELALSIVLCLLSITLIALKAGFGLTGFKMNQITTICSTPYHTIKTQIVHLQLMSQTIALIVSAVSTGCSILVIGCYICSSNKQKQSQNSQNSVQKKHKTLYIFVSLAIISLIVTFGSSLSIFMSNKECQVLNQTQLIIHIALSVTVLVLSLIFWGIQMYLQVLKQRQQKKKSIKKDTQFQQQEIQRHFQMQQMNYMSNNFNRQGLLGQLEDTIYGQFIQQQQKQDQFVTRDQNKKYQKYPKLSNIMLSFDEKTKLIQKMENQVKQSIVLQNQAKKQIKNLNLFSDPDVVISQGEYDNFQFRENIQDFLKNQAQQLTPFECNQSQKLKQLSFKIQKENESSVHFNKTYENQIQINVHFAKIKHHVNQLRKANQPQIETNPNNQTEVKKDSQDAQTLLFLFNNGSKRNKLSKQQLQYLESKKCPFTRYINEDEAKNHSQFQKSNLKNYKQELHLHIVRNQEYGVKSDFTISRIYQQALNKQLKDVLGSRYVQKQTESKDKAPEKTSKKTLINKVRGKYVH